MSAEDTANPGDFAWAPRRQLTLEQARRRSDMVRLLRMVFVAGAAISIGLLAGHVVRNAVAGLSGERKAFRSNEIVTMINPRFTGRDGEGQAYVITADSAQRRRADENVSTSSIRGWSMTWEARSPRPRAFTTGSTESWIFTGMCASPTRPATVSARARRASMSRVAH